MGRIVCFGELLLRPVPPATNCCCSRRNSVSMWEGPKPTWVSRCPGLDIRWPWSAPWPAMRWGRMYWVNCGGTAWIRAVCARTPRAAWACTSSPPARYSARAKWSTTARIRRSRAALQPTTTGQLLQDAQWLHVSGVSPALGPHVAAATLAAARAARQAGVRVSFDGNFRPRLWQRWGGDAQAVLRELFAQADIVFADYRDMEVVLGTRFTQPDLMERIDAAAAAAFGAFPQLQWMACTQRQVLSVDHHVLGAVLLGCDGTRAQAPLRHLQGIVDRIGGGDAFAAGILHGILSGLDADATVRFGLAAGALKHSIPGDFNPVSEADVLALMGEERFDVRR